jgi:hypothetical protein
MLNIYFGIAVSKTSGMNLLRINESEISAPQCPTHYCPAGNVTCSILTCTGMSGCQELRSHLKLCALLRNRLQTGMDEGHQPPSLAL